MVLQNWPGRGPIILKTDNLVLGTSVSYLRTNPSPASFVAPEALAKGILLPPTPNPSQGEMQFRFSLPSDKDADLTLFHAQAAKCASCGAGGPRLAWTSPNRTAPTTRVPRSPRVCTWRDWPTPGMVFTQRFALVR